MTERKIRVADTCAWFLVPFLTCLIAFGLRMLEWPSWQDPEYRLGNEMLLATLTPITGLPGQWVLAALWIIQWLSRSG